MFGPKILWERRDAGQAFADQLRLAQGPAASFEILRHLAGLRAEVAIGSQHAFWQREDVDLQFEQILDGIVVLETIHSPERRLREGFLGADSNVQQSL